MIDKYCPPVLDLQDPTTISSTTTISPNSNIKPISKTQVITDIEKLSKKVWTR